MKFFEKNNNQNEEKKKKSDGCRRARAKARQIETHKTRIGAEKEERSLFC